MAAQYACQIMCGIDGEARTFLLDNVQATTVSLSSTLTTHPTLSGDMIADHMYKEPASMTIRGSYSINGSSTMRTDSGYSKLAGFQHLFERIKNEGILCDIVKTSKSLSQGRFMLRQNMALTRIEWTENINTLDFTFSFTQVLKAKIQIEAVDLKDTYLPNVTGVNTLNFTDALLNWDYIDALVLQAYEKSGVYSAERLEAFAKRFNIAGYDSVGHAAFSFVSALTYLMGAGTIFNIVDDIAAWGASLSNRDALYEYMTEREKEKADEELYENISSIREAIASVNNQVTVQQVSANTDQQCVAVIDNEYYYFIFEKNNTSGHYRLTIKNMDNVQVGSLANVTAAPTEFTSTTSSNKLIQGSGGSYVFLVRDENGDADDLTNYYVVSSKVKPEDFEQTLTDLIIEGMKNG